jgi:hypothetical protein
VGTALVAIGVMTLVGMLAACGVIGRMIVF